MAETKINASQTTITASDIGAARAATVLPTASVSEEGKIYQFVGTTTGSYTNGYFYKCVSDGQDPATYSWERVDVQPAPVIPDPLPSQTGQSGKFLTTNGTDASWATVNALQNEATAGKGIKLAKDSYGVDSPVIIGGGASYSNYGLIALGPSCVARGGSSISIGWHTETNGDKAIAIGHRAKATAAYAIQLGYWMSNTTPNTFKVANANGNFEIMSADGTIPTDRFTATPSTDGTYVPTITISSGVETRSWAAPSGGGATSATATLAVNDWSSNTQTVNVTGVTASNNVIVAAAPASQADYTSAGVLCTAQGSGTLSFSCQTVPTNAITVNILIL